MELRVISHSEGPPAVADGQSIRKMMHAIVPTNSFVTVLEVITPVSKIYESNVNPNSGFRSADGGNDRGVHTPNSFPSSPREQRAILARSEIFTENLLWSARDTLRSYGFTSPDESERSETDRIKLPVVVRRIMAQERAALVFQKQKVREESHLDASSKIASGTQPVSSVVNQSSNSAMISGSNQTSNYTIKPIIATDNQSLSSGKGASISSHTSNDDQLPSADIHAQTPHTAYYASSTATMISGIDGVEMDSLISPQHLKAPPFTASSLASPYSSHSPASRKHALNAQINPSKISPTQSQNLKLRAHNSEFSSQNSDVLSSVTLDSENPSQSLSPKDHVLKRDASLSAADPTSNASSDLQQMVKYFAGAIATMTPSQLIAFSAQMGLDGIVPSGVRNAVADAARLSAKIVASSEENTRDIGQYRNANLDPFRSESADTHYLQSEGAHSAATMSTAGRSMRKKVRRRNGAVSSGKNNGESDRKLASDLIPFGILSRTSEMQEESHNPRQKRIHSRGGTTFGPSRNGESKSSFHFIRDSECCPPSMNSNSNRPVGYESHMNSSIAMYSSDETNADDSILESIPNSASASAPSLSASILHKIRSNDPKLCHMTRKQRASSHPSVLFSDSAIDSELRLESIDSSDESRDSFDSDDLSDLMTDDDDTTLSSSEDDEETDEDDLSASSSALDDEDDGNSGLRSDISVIHPLPHLANASSRSLNNAMSADLAPAPPLSPRTAFSASLAASVPRELQLQPGMGSRAVLLERLAASATGTAFDHISQVPTQQLTRLIRAQTSAFPPSREEIAAPLEQKEGSLDASWASKGVRSTSVDWTDPSYSEPVNVVSSESVYSFSDSGSHDKKGDNLMEIDVLGNPTNRITTVPATPMPLGLGGGLSPRLEDLIKTSLHTHHFQHSFLFPRTAEAQVVAPLAGQKSVRFTDSVEQSEGQKGALEQKPVRAENKNMFENDFHDTLTYEEALTPAAPAGPAVMKFSGGQNSSTRAEFVTANAMAGISTVQGSLSQPQIPPTSKGKNSASEGPNRGARLVLSSAIARMAVFPPEAVHPRLQIRCSGHAVQLPHAELLRSDPFLRVARGSGFNPAVFGFPLVHGEWNLSHSPSSGPNTGRHANDSTSVMNTSSASLPNAAATGSDSHGLPSGPGGVSAGLVHGIGSKEVTIRGEQIHPHLPPSFPAHSASPLSAFLRQDESRYFSARLGLAVPHYRPSDRSLCYFEMDISDSASRRAGKLPEGVGVVPQQPAFVAVGLCARSNALNGLLGMPDSCLLPDNVSSYGQQHHAGSTGGDVALSLTSTGHLLCGGHWSVLQGMTHSNSSYHNRYSSLDDPLSTSNTSNNHSARYTKHLFGAGDTVGILVRWIGSQGPWAPAGNSQAHLPFFPRPSVGVSPSSEVGRHDAIQLTFSVNGRVVGVSGVLSVAAGTELYPAVSINTPGIRVTGNFSPPDVKFASRQGMVIALPQEGHQNCPTSTYLAGTQGYAIFTLDGSILVGHTDD